MTDSILRVCRACSRYTLSGACPSCGASTRTPHPARFDATDRYGTYRRRLLAAVRSEGGTA